MDIQIILLEGGALGSLITFVVLLTLARRQAKLTNMSVIIFVAMFLGFIGMTALAPFVRVVSSFSSGAADDK